MITGINNSDPFRSVISSPQQSTTAVQKVQTDAPETQGTTGVKASTLAVKPEATQPTQQEDPVESLKKMGQSEVNPTSLNFQPAASQPNALKAYAAGAAETPPMLKIG